MVSKKKNPLVSIFIPVYNAEKFIAEAIETSLSQSYENIEIVISDDASTDGTWDIIEKFCNCYPDKILSFRQKKNLGLTRNCNFTLEKCSGEYICFMAGDDLLGPECITKALSFFENHADLAIVFHRFQRVDENSKIIKQEIDLKPHFGNATDFLKKGIYLMANGMVIRKSAYPNLRYNSSLKYGSDHEFIYDVLLYKNSRFYYTNEVHAYWRFNPQSITNTKALQTTIDAFISNYYLSLKYNDYAIYIKNTLISYIEVFYSNNILNRFEVFFYKYIFSKTNSRHFTYFLFKFVQKKFIQRIQSLLETL